MCIRDSLTVHPRLRHCLPAGGGVTVDAAQPRIHLGCAASTVTPPPAGRQCRSLGCTVKFYGGRSSRSVATREAGRLPRLTGRPRRHAALATSSTTTAGSPVSARCTCTCLLYTSDAADDLLCVDLGGRRI